MIDLSSTSQVSMSFSLNGARIYNRDCLELLKVFPDQSVDLIVTDPPYGISYVSKRAKIGSVRSNLNQELVGDKGIMVEWLPEAARVLKDGGAMYMFTRWDVWGDWYREVNKDLPVKNMIVWVKSNHTAGDLKGNYAYKHELILLATKGRHLPSWPKREMNVWMDKSLSSTEPRVHPTQKPLGIIQHCILNSCPDDGIVLDPFAGSGTTLVAASQLGIRSVGMEIDPEYYKVAIKRLEEEG